MRSIAAVKLAADSGFPRRIENHRRDRREPLFLFAEYRVPGRRELRESIPPSRAPTAAFELNILAVRPPRASLSISA